MKQIKLKYLFVCFTLVPLLCFSQAKTDNLITVNLSDTTGAYNQIVNLLKTERYKLSTADKDNGFIATKDKTIGRYINTLVKYRFRITGNTVSISGTWFFSNMQYGKIFPDESLSFLPGWTEMNRLAKLLGAVTYSKKE